MLPALEVPGPGRASSFLRQAHLVVPSQEAGCQVVRVRGWGQSRRQAVQLWEWGTWGGLQGLGRWVLRLFCLYMCTAQGWWQHVVWGAAGRERLPRGGSVGGFQWVSSASRVSVWGPCWESGGVIWQAGLRSLPTCTCVHVFCNCVSARCSSALCTCESFLGAAILCGQVNTWARVSSGGQTSAELFFESS